MAHDQRAGQLDVDRAAVLEEALKLVSLDMHATSGRPCATCQQVTASLGEPFGCIAWQEKWGKR